jgi:hypothetical protein
MNSQGQPVSATLVTDLNGNPIPNPNPPNTSTIANTPYNANQYFNAQGVLQGNISDTYGNYLIGPVPAPGVNATLATAISIGLQAQSTLGAGVLAGLATGQPVLGSTAGLTAGFALIGNDYKGSGAGNPQQAYTILNSDGTTSSVVNQPLVLAFQDWASFALGVTNQVYLGSSTLGAQAVDAEIWVYPHLFNSTSGPATIARNQVSGEGGANYDLGSSTSNVADNLVPTPTSSGPVLNQISSSWGVSPLPVSSNGVPPASASGEPTGWAITYTVPSSSTGQQSQGLVSYYDSSTNQYVLNGGLVSIPASAVTDLSYTNGNSQVHFGTDASGNLTGASVSIVQGANSATVTDSVSGNQITVPGIIDTSQFQAGQPVQIINADGTINIPSTIGLLTWTPTSGNVAVQVPGSTAINTIIDGNSVTIIQPQQGSDSTPYAVIVPTTGAGAPSSNGTISAAWK